MSIYLVDVHVVTHTCPADPNPHPVHTSRTIVHVTPGGPCRTPITIGCDDGTTMQLPCGRREPRERQCDACRTVVTERTITFEHDPTPVLRGQPLAPSGYAKHPCTVCAQPLAAILAPTGRHILCAPQPERRRAA
jgi:hypothetical protein